MKKTCKDFNVKPCSWCMYGDTLWTYDLCDIICLTNYLYSRDKINIRDLMKMYRYPNPNQLFYLKVAIDNYFPQYKDELAKFLVLV